MMNAEAYQELLDALAKVFGEEGGKGGDKKPKKATISIISIGDDKPAKIPAKKKKVEAEEEDELA